MTIGAFDRCEALVQIAAIKIFMNHMRYNRSVNAILMLEKIVISALKFIG